MLTDDGVQSPPPLGGAPEVKGTPATASSSSPAGSADVTVPAVGPPEKFASIVVPISPPPPPAPQSSSQFVSDSSRPPHSSLAGRVDSQDPQQLNANSAQAAKSSSSALSSPATMTNGNAAATASQESNSTIVESVPPAPSGGSEPEEDEEEEGASNHNSAHHSGTTSSSDTSLGEAVVVSLGGDSVAADKTSDYSAQDPSSSSTCWQEAFAFLCVLDAVRLLREAAQAGRTQEDIAGRPLVLEALQTLDRGLISGGISMRPWLESFLCFSRSSVKC